MYTPCTEITLLQSPLSADNEHQIKFGSIAEQIAYFQALPKSSLLNSTFQRKDNAIRYNGNIETLYKYNYVMYKNKEITDKYFYAFITNLEYINENVTLIHMQTDVWQTWQFDLNFLKSFVEREHFETDEYNSLADSPAHGQLEQTTLAEYSYSGGYFCFCSADITQDDTTNVNVYDFAIDKFTVPCMILYWSASDCLKMNDTLQKISNKGRADRILTLVYMPYLTDNMITNMNLAHLGSTDVGDLDIFNGFDTAAEIKSTISVSFAQEHTFRKELTYPYAKLVVEDITTGQKIELAPEKFDTTETRVAQFEIQPTLTETPSLRIIPRNYAGQSYAYGDSLLIKYNTTLPVVNNLYAKYMMNNELTDKFKMYESGVSALGSLATVNAQGLQSSLSEIVGVVAQESQAAKLAPQISSFTDGAFERILFQNGIKISLYTMDSFHMQQARDFWTMFGYPCHGVKVPNFIGSARDYNYEKIINPNIEGNNIPAADMLQIEEIFKNGVTLWKSNKFRLY